MFFCSFDFVELIDSSGKKITDHISGFKPGLTVTIESKTNQSLYVKFTSDSSHTNRGFLAKFSIALGKYPCVEVPRGPKDLLFIMLLSTKSTTFKKY